MTENRKSKSKFYWIVLLTGVILVPIGLLVMFASGQISGQEFSPDDFSRRSFKYNQTPWFNWVLSKKTYSDQTTTLEESLVMDGFVVPVINKTKNWHLVRDSGTSGRLMSHECDARFLTDYLDLRNDEGDYYWTQWNTDYPQSAKIFWPKIVDLARHQMYLKIPEVMQVAMELQSDEPDEFEKVLDQVIAQAYLELGRLDRELNRLERAKIRINRAIEIQPSAEASQELSKCLAAKIPAATDQEADE